MTGDRHLLVIRFSAMGDVAMTVPVVKALLNQNPDLRITYVSRPGFAGFFEGIPRLTYHNVDLDGRHKGFTGLLTLFTDLKKQGTHNALALADLHNNLRTKILRRL